MSITSAVGNGGRNLKPDVLKIQKLINENLGKLTPLAPLVEDGLMGAKTLFAIYEFQKRVVGLKMPDSRVDPGGRTFKTLLAVHGPAKPEGPNEDRSPDREKEAAPGFLQLPAGGAGYYSYSTNDQRWGTAKTIDSLKKAAAAFHKETGVKIGVGHISKKDGGKFPPHKSHRKGTDVDLRPIRKDGRGMPVTIQSRDYDHDNTEKLVEILLKDPNLYLILFNDDKINGVRKWAGHDNHLHVRFKA